MKESRYDIFLKDFGKNVRRIRKEKGLSMEALANEAEIEYRQIGRIERGEVNPTIITILRIAEVLQVDFHLFFLIQIK